MPSPSPTFFCPAGERASGHVWGFCTKHGESLCLCQHDCCLLPRLPVGMCSLHMRSLDSGLYGQGTSMQSEATCPYLAYGAHPGSCRLFVCPMCLQIFVRHRVGTCISAVE